MLAAMMHACFMSHFSRISLLQIYKKNLIEIILYKKFKHMLQVNNSAALCKFRDLLLLHFQANLIYHFPSVKVLIV